MNVNIIVLNGFHDLRSADIGDRWRDRDEQFARNFSSPDTSTAAEQVIELTPQEGAWVGKGGTRAAQPAMYSLAREPRALHASPIVTTYDHEGKVHHSAQDKGLRINITA